MTEKKFEQWVHVKITDKEVADQLDAMVDSDDVDRSKLVRRLIRDEWKRRTAQLTLMPVKKVINAKYAQKAAV